MAKRLTPIERAEREKEDLDRYAARMQKRFKCHIMPDAPKCRRLVSYEKLESGFTRFTYANGAEFFARGPLVDFVLTGKRIYE